MYNGLRVKEVSDDLGRILLGEVLGPSLEMDHSGREIQKSKGLGREVSKEHESNLSSVSKYLLAII